MQKVGFFRCTISLSNTFLTKGILNQKNGLKIITVRPLFHVTIYDWDNGFVYLYNLMSGLLTKEPLNKWSAAEQRVF